ncbi:hypothetical protein OIU79_015700 [Salix purpurea]|uniref:Uncharacterized protein n=3 Tax=Salix TaxID=40685 RepID=A0A9Q0SPV5_SALPP|nr:hypothetical protein OIU84_013071 [Salix udensis]KAJ6685729.1 hypothetical protein OIU79_015700 [Salix purpurea]KAJ6709640.1 hypothetical protein OIU74_010692 [Salix koriyanagi]
MFQLPVAIHTDLE